MEAEALNSFEYAHGSFWFICSESMEIENLGKQAEFCPSESRLQKSDSSKLIVRGEYFGLASRDRKGVLFSSGLRYIKVASAGR